MRVHCVVLLSLGVALAAAKGGDSSREGVRGSRTISALLSLIGVRPAARPVVVSAAPAVIVLPAKPVSLAHPVYKPSYPSHPPAYPTHPPVYPTAGPVYPTQRPVYPTVGPVYPTVGPVYPTGGPVTPGSLLYSWRVPELAGRRFSWSEADRQCRVRGLRLVSIENDHKNQLIIQQIDSASELGELCRDNRRLLHQ